jgi:hypothetical protein
MEDSLPIGEFDATDPEYVALQDILQERASEAARNIHLAINIENALLDAKIVIEHDGDPEEAERIIEEHRLGREFFFNIIRNDPETQRIAQMNRNEAAAEFEEEELQEKYHFLRYKQAKAHSLLQGIEFEDAALILFGEDCAEEIGINAILTSRANGDGTDN